MIAPRDPKPTVNFIDVYCAYYQDLFPEVRSFENFEALHLGMLSDIKFDRIFSNGKTELRYIREIIFGTRGTKCYWQITTDPINLPEGSTWWVMTKIPGIKYKEVGNIFGLRTWVEYGLKQSKNELGWSDFRLTEYLNIQKWWEIVCSAYLLVSLYSEHLNQSQRTTQRVFSEHL